MEIDITKAPPADIFRYRVRHIRISAVLLFLAACGLLLIVYGITVAPAQSTFLETVALSLLVGPALLFVYYGGKLNAYKGLSAEQKKELIFLGLRHLPIAAYCRQVAGLGRELTFAEYEACKEWAEAAGADEGRE